MGVRGTGPTDNFAAVKLGVAVSAFMVGVAWLLEVIHVT
jgi:hypothetical protein